MTVLRSAASLSGALAGRAAPQNANGWIISTSTARRSGARLEGGLGLISGWDFGHKEYRGALFDSFGNSSMMRGRREGQKLTFESMDDVLMHGHATRLRFTFDASEARRVKFTAEHSVNGAFVIDEQEIHVPTGE